LFDVVARHYIVPLGQHHEEKIVCEYVCFNGKLRARLYRIIACKYMLLFHSLNKDLFKFHLNENIVQIFVDISGLRRRGLWMLELIDYSTTLVYTRAL